LQLVPYTINSLQGSGTSKARCLARKANWETYCHTPVIVTYVPDGVSSTWKDEDIQHDSHGGHMFEEDTKVKNLINPESINPHYVKKPEVKEKEEYEDTPEYRKSLHMKVGKKIPRLPVSIKINLRSQILLFGF
jgi:hypothetical protein